MSFSIRRAGLDDIPGLVDVWFRGFNTPDILSVFPNSKHTRAWIAESIAADLKDDTRNTVYMIMTDDERGGKVVSLSKWVVQPEGSPVPEWNKRWPEKIAHDMSWDILSVRFFQPMERQHAKATGDRAHYFLEVLATHNEYRKRGLASQLLKWGYENADKAGVDCYLDSLPDAKSVYEKSGYIQQPYQDDKAHSLPMLRPAGTKVHEKMENLG